MWKFIEVIMITLTGVDDPGYNAPAFCNGLFTLALALFCGGVLYLIDAPTWLIILFVWERTARWYQLQIKLNRVGDFNAEKI